MRRVQVLAVDRHPHPVRPDGPDARREVWDVDRRRCVRARIDAPESSVCGVNPSSRRPPLPPHRQTRRRGTCRGAAHPSPGGRSPASGGHPGHAGGQPAGNPNPPPRPRSPATATSPGLVTPDSIVFVDELAGWSLARRPGRGVLNWIPHRSPYPSDEAEGSVGYDMSNRAPLSRARIDLIDQGGVTAFPIGSPERAAAIDKWAGGFAKRRQRRGRLELRSSAPTRTSVPGRPCP